MFTSSACVVYLNATAFNEADGITMRDVSSCTIRQNVSNRNQRDGVAAIDLGPGNVFERNSAGGSSAVRLQLGRIRTRPCSPQTAAAPRIRSASGRTPAGMAGSNARPPPRSRWLRYWVPGTGPCDLSKMKPQMCPVCAHAELIRVHLGSLRRMMIGRPSLGTSSTSGHLRDSVARPGIPVSGVQFSPCPPFLFPASAHIRRTPLSCRPSALTSPARLGRRASLTDARPRLT